MNIEVMSKISGYLQIAIICFGLTTSMLAFVKYKIDKKISASKDLQIRQLDSYSELYRLTVSLRSDSRAALDELVEMAENKYDVRQSLVVDTLKDFPKEAEHVNLLEYPIDWQKIGVDPTKSSLEDFQMLYNQAIPIYQTKIMETVWKSSQIHEKDKIQFLIDIIRTTPSIRCLREACIILSEETKLGRNFIAWKEYINWWEHNKEKYKAS